MEHFEPSFHAYVGYFVGFCLRYVGFAGVPYLLLQVGFRERWSRYRIQSAYPASAEVRHEIVWSLINAACTGLATLLMYDLIHDGRSSVYFRIDERGYAYFALSAALVVIGYDSWNYWQHRLLHKPWWFRHVHHVHHRAGNPTPFGTFAAHPIETFMGNAFYVLFVICVPIHPLALGLAGGYLFVYGTLCHLGYEFYPRWVAGHPLFGWLNNATYHNIHHSSVGTNFAGWFLYWDRLMGTSDPGYPAAFALVTDRAAGDGSASRAAG